MRTTSRAIAEVLVDQAEGKTPEQLGQIMRTAVEYLAQHGLLKDWRQIEANIHTVWKHRYGASKITVASAHPLTQEARQALDSLAPGADLQLVVDSRLMGGAVVRVDDRRIDGTILGALTRLKHTLLS